MMQTLTLNEIKCWLIDNRDEYQELKSQEFPPFRNNLYNTYNILSDFIEYYTFRSKCRLALKELKAIEFDNFSELPKWTQNYEILGSEDLLMFEINYFDWIEEVPNDKLKIHHELFTERKPFLNILSFCRVFQVLYWNYAVHKKELTKQEKNEIKNELTQIMNHPCIETT